MGRLVESRLVQGAADRAHASVHHVGRRDDVRARPRVHQRHPRQQPERRVVLDLVPGDEPAVPVRRVLAEADVRDDQQLLALRADRAHGSRHDAVLGVALRSLRVLAFGQAEEDHARDAQRLHLAGLARGFVHREVEAAGQRCDLLAHPRARHDEEGIDQAVRREARLAHHPAQALGPAETARTFRGEGHGEPCYSSSSPKKNASAHLRAQKSLPKARMAQLSQIHLKQIGHLFSRISRSSTLQPTHSMDVVTIGGSIARRSP